MTTPDQDPNNKPPEATIPEALEAYEENLQWIPKEHENRVSGVLYAYEDETGRLADDTSGLMYAVEAKPALATKEPREVQLIAEVRTELDATLARLRAGLSREFTASTYKIADVMKTAAEVLSVQITNPDDLANYQEAVSYIRHPEQLENLDKKDAADELLDMLSIEEPPEHPFKGKTAREVAEFFLSQMSSEETEQAANAALDWERLQYIADMTTREGLKLQVRYKAIYTTLPTFSSDEAKAAAEVFLSNFWYFRAWEEAGWKAPKGIDTYKRDPYLARGFDPDAATVTATRRRAYGGRDGATDTAINASLDYVRFHRGLEQMYRNGYVYEGYEHSGARGGVSGFILRLVHRGPMQAVLPVSSPSVDRSLRFVGGGHPGDPLTPPAQLMRLVIRGMKPVDYSSLDDHIGGSFLHVPLEGTGRGKLDGGPMR